jgi:hypothetical protein
VSFTGEHVEIHYEGWDAKWNETLCIEQNQQLSIKPNMTNKQCERLILETLISTNSNSIFSPHQSLPNSNQKSGSTYIFKDAIKPISCCIHPICSSIYPSNSSSLVHLNPMNESAPCEISAVLWPVQSVSMNSNVVLILK